MKDEQNIQNQINKNVHDFIIRKKGSVTLDKIFEKVAKKIQIQDAFHEAKKDEIKTRM